MSGGILAAMVTLMTPEQLATYQETCRRKAAEAAEQRRLRAGAALRLARRAAEMLRSEFGATDVYLFGSLAEGTPFGAHSDIDLAAHGLGDAHYKALGRLLSLSRDFEFDLVDLDSCAEGLREAVVAHGVSL
jgi:uncharacterized protein